MSTRRSLLGGALGAVALSLSPALTRAQALPPVHVFKSPSCDCCRLWVEHLTAMDDLREGVGLQAYGQRDPLVVYKTQGYEYFQQLLANIQHDVVHTIFRVQPAVAQQPVRTQVTEESDQAPAAPGEPDGNGIATVQRKARKVGANEPCPCGSGKKYKHCHGAPARTALV